MAACDVQLHKRATIKLAAVFLARSFELKMSSPLVFWHRWGRHLYSCKTWSQPRWSMFVEKPTPAGSLKDAHPEFVLDCLTVNAQYCSRKTGQKLLAINSLRQPLHSSGHVIPRQNKQKSANSLTVLVLLVSYIYILQEGGGTACCTVQMAKGLTNFRKFCQGTKQTPLALAILSCCKVTAIDWTNSVYI